MKLFISAALIAGSVTAAAAYDISQSPRVFGQGKIIDKVPLYNGNGVHVWTKYLVFFDLALYECRWEIENNTAWCLPLK